MLVIVSEDDEIVCLNEEECNRIDTSFLYILAIALHFLFYWSLQSVYV